MRLSMHVIEEIKAKRTAGKLHCGYLPHSTELPLVASKFLLSTDLENYRRVAKSEAEQILIRILHKDMAYDCEIMSEKSAAALSTAFLHNFEDSTASFFTNINHSEEEKKSGPLTWEVRDWRPVTNATFDAGIIAISDSEAACLWIEDED